MRKSILSSLLLLLFVSGIVVAQERTISGTVTSIEDGASIPGVNVLVKGTTTGTITDVDGRYRIQVGGEDAVLVFSYIGFESVEIEVGARSTIDVQMAADVTQLSEVVVTGYGTQLKTDLTGNIASVSGEEIQNVPVPSFEQAIQGRTAGVLITNQNGKVGQGIDIRIRGASSVSASNQPLYVIDGVVVTSESQSINAANTNPLADLNFNDIESIEILKDASASAIYGSRAANGVILITTKRGKVGKTKFTVGYQKGFSQPTNKVDWLDRDGYFELFDEAFANSSSDGTINGTVFGLTRAGLYDIFVPGWDDPQNFNTDWQELAFQDGQLDQIDVSASGGTEKTRFFISGQFSEQDGILTKNSFERNAGRINIDHRATDKLSFGLDFSLSRTKNNRLSTDNAFSTTLQAIAQAPVQSPFDPNGPGGLNQNTLYYNFLFHRDQSSFVTRVIRNLTNIYANYEIVNGLTFTTKFGIDLLTQNEEQFFGRNTNTGQGVGGSGTNRWVQVANYTFDNYLTYAKTINDQHDVSVTGGISYQRVRRDQTSVTGQGFPSDLFRQVASAANITAGSSTERDKIFASYFARANYKLNNKYLFGLSGRIDGSSIFGDNERYGFFPSVSAGWIVSEESFLSGLGTLSFLKVRASWGQTGNAFFTGSSAIDPDVPALGLFDGNGAYGGISGTSPSQVPNPDLKWETTSQIDIGIDFGLFEDRITGEIDYYFKDTEDLLLNVNVPGTTGFRTASKNVGNLENKGWEILLNSNNLVGEFSWSTNFNIAFNDNKITNLDGQVLTGGFINEAQEGQPIGVFVGPEYAGVDPANGDALYFLNDGTEGTTNNVNAAEQVVIGSPLPDFIGGFGNNFAYKGIELSVLLQFVYGNDVYNGGGRFQETNGDFFDNNTEYQLNRWQNPGDITDVPQARLFGGNGTAHSSRYLQDGSYMRLKTVVLSYNLPASVLSKIGMESARVYVSGQNLLTWTAYGDDGRAGWDPEVNTDFLAGNIGLGNDFYAAPQARTITFGATLGF